MSNWSCIDDFNIIASIGYISEPLIILIWGEGFSPHKPSTLSYFLCKCDVWIWGRGIMVQHHVIWRVYLSQIIHTFKKDISKKEKHCQWFFSLKLLFPSTNSYCIRQFNCYFNKFYNNRDISSILYVNHKGNWLFVANTIETHSKQWKQWDQHMFRNRSYTCNYIKVNNTWSVPQQLLHTIWNIHNLSRKEPSQLLVLINQAM